MGTLKNSPAFPPDRIHTALSAINPTYASLTVTQKPSWVCPPSSYAPGTISSLSVAFEDPDGSKLKALLAEHYLYIFGNRASVKKWKHHQKNNKDKAKSNSAKHVQGEDTHSIEDADLPLPTSAHPQLSAEAAAFFETASAPPSHSSKPTHQSERTTKPPHPYDAK